MTDQIHTQETQAQAFAARNSDYFFNDAHHLVEAQACVEATEIAHNTFRFPDNSILKLHGYCVTCSLAPAADPVDR